MTRHSPSFRRVACLALALWLLVLPACRRAGPSDAAPDVQMTLAPAAGALAVGPSRLEVTLRDANGAPIDGATGVTLRGDMSHAGMQPVLATAETAGNGVYVADFEWTMAGDWIVTVEATLPDGRLKMAQFEYTISAD